MYGTTEAAQDVSFADMAKKQQQIVSVLLADPAIATVGSFVGSGGGGNAQNNGRMFIALKPPNQRPPVDEVIARLRAQTAKVPGISLFLQPVQDIRVGGPDDQGPLSIHSPGRGFGRIEHLGAPAWSNG